MSSESCENVCHSGKGSGFEIIVVLFILLIIVGATFIGNSHDDGHCCN
ncbi:YjcZ family sporulation protein [Sporosarcina sp. ANT_H38]|nr:YjcZ family sporulation protein [Sporosarcina sp. ANT_H38]KAA0965517.1 YjcZ family sporulation protein [Sporosarcina sp. ANT_H38]